MAATGAESAVYDCLVRCVLAARERCDVARRAGLSAAAETCCDSGECVAGAVIANSLPSKSSRTSTSTAKPRSWKSTCC